MLENHLDFFGPDPGLSKQVLPLHLALSQQSYEEDYSLGCTKFLQAA